MVTRVRVGDLRDFARGVPVEFPGLDDDAAEGRAVAAEELGGGVDDDVGIFISVFSGKMICLSYHHVWSNSRFCK